MKNYSNEDIENFKAKDKRISFLSLFSSISKNEPDIIEATEKAIQVNERLYKEYPLISTTMQPSYKPTGYNFKPTREGDNCPCGAPRVEKSGVKNGKEWRGMFCKFRKCAPIWLPRVITKEQADDVTFQDDIDDQAHHQEIPEEYR